MILRAMTFLDMIWKNLLDGEVCLVLREKMPGVYSSVSVCSRKSVHQDAQ